MITRGRHKCCRIMSCYGRPAKNSLQPKPGRFATLFPTSLTSTLCLSRYALHLIAHSRNKANVLSLWPTTCTPLVAGSKSLSVRLSRWCMELETQSGRDTGPRWDDWTVSQSHCILSLLLKCLRCVHLFSSVRVSLKGETQSIVPLVIYPRCVMKENYATKGSETVRI